MRFLPILFLCLAASGCISDPDDENSVGQTGECSPKMFRLFLTPDLGLALEPETGMADGNGFAEAFLTNDMEEFTGPASLLGDGFTWIMEGNFTYHVVVETGYAVAPIVDTGDPSEAYHFFNQFGTSQGFTPGYDVWYSDPVTTADQYVYDGGWEMPAGGYPIEAGDDIRFLLTNLVLPDEGQRNPRINTHDSYLEFTARCELPNEPIMGSKGTFAVSMLLNQGLLTGAIPASELNQFVLEYTPTNESKVQFRLTAADEIPKDDVDMTFYYDGKEIWSGGSPYTNEVATIWAENFVALGINGPITVEINGYSTVNYEGTLEIETWR